MQNYYNEIKDILIKNEVTKQIKNYSINKSDLTSYYEVGKILIEAQGGEERSKYGNKLIKEYSIRLTKELGKGYSERSLYNMRQYYIRFNEKTILSAVRAKLSWNHYKLLLSKSDNEIGYYINLSLSQNLSYRQLQSRIKNKEYERLDKKTKAKLIKKEKLEITDYVKEPIIIKSSLNYEKISELVLKKLILEDISNFMKELGNGYSFIDSEYKITIGNTNHYIDILLYNINYNCYVVIELKVTSLSSSHIGQIEKYMNYIDKHIKNINQDKTIGIILCKKNNKLLMEYVSDERILSREYIVI